MSRQIIITLRVSKEERDQISKLARMLQRSRSDAIRVVLLQALKKLESGSGPLGLEDKEDSS